MSHAQQPEVVLAGNAAPFDGNGGTCSCVQLPIRGHVVCGDGDIKVGLRSGLRENREVVVGGGGTASLLRGIDFGTPCQECVEGGGVRPMNGNLGNGLRDQVVRRPCDRGGH